MDQRPSYAAVFFMFLRNSMVRDLSFRSNFWIECISSLSWVIMNLGFYLLIFRYTNSIGNNTGWGEYEFFVFLATTLLVNSLVQMFFMPNIQEFSELIRTGKLDFALLKPIDTQFLVSFEKVNFPSMANFLFGLVLMGVSLYQLTHREANPIELTAGMVAMYVLFLLCGVAILYSLMIVLAASSIWLGRNTSLYDFWFYITSFSRYPMEIYNSGGLGITLQLIFTFVIPILIVVNVPARIMAQPFGVSSAQMWLLPIYMLAATALSLLASRWVFKLSLRSYRSASS
ncbi:ABC transporter permease [Blastopirellula marina]|uniref:ABC transporter permease n=1 Tax=Blastopirellula marina TaxID=124 RepID=A0A2S8GEH0_9BACT|nr:ABC-2 family transporter protein [Blastopirellula marina]PQO42839.1 ABC transporter permease [Blastopirellula marina]PTL46605.1 ABC transporter permease [Blastopirellula marina]